MSIFAGASSFFHHFVWGASFFHHFRSSFVLARFVFPSFQSSFVLECFVCLNNWGHMSANGRFIFHHFL